MTEFDRRGFMKKLLVAGVAAVPAYSVFPKIARGPLSLLALPSSSENLESGSQQLRISPAGSPLTFQNFLRSGSEWKAATLLNNPFIAGPSFALVTSHVRREGSSILCEGDGKAESLDRRTLSYTWNSEISAIKPVSGTDGGSPSEDSDACWFRFRTTLHLPAPMHLRQDLSLIHI